MFGLRRSQSSRAIVTGASTDRKNPASHALELKWISAICKIFDVSSEIFMLRVSGPKIFSENLQNNS
jgi:hypothetical protein